MESINDILLKVSFSEFEQQVQQAINEGEKIQIVAKSQQELDAIENTISGWKNNTIELLNTLFQVPDNSLVKEFRYANSNQFRIRSVLQLHDLVQRLREKLSRYTSYLHSLIKYLEISDIVVGIQTANLQERKNYTIEQKQLFV